MRSTSVAIVAMAAVAAPSIAAPVSIAPLLKELGKGLLTGGAFAGLESLVEGSSSSTPSSRAVSSEELVIRSAITDVLEKLIGVGEKALPDVLKNAAIGGAASGVANGVVSGAISKRGNKSKEVVKATRAEIVEELERRGFFDQLKDIFNKIQNDPNLVRRGGVAGVVGEVAEDTIGSTIGKNILSGIGSALGGTVITELASKLFNRTVTPEEVELVSREPLGSVGKGLLGTAVSLGVSSLAGEAVSELEKLLKRELDLEERTVAGTIAEDTLKSTIGKNIIGGIGSALGGTAIGALIDKLSSRDVSDDTDDSDDAAFFQALALALGSGEANELD